MPLTKVGAQELMRNYYLVNNSEEIADKAVEILVKFGVDDLVAFAYEKGRQESLLDNLLKGVDVK